MLLKYRKAILPGFIILLFAAIYTSISLVNHYYFRTFGWDLGIYNNAAWNYIHLHWSSNTIMLPLISNQLGDHFELYPLIFSPLIYIFGSKTFLIIQILFIAFGGFGIYRYFQFKTGNNTFSSLAMLHFFLGWGIFSAIIFDFHNNVLSAMLVPWFLLYFEKKDMKKAAIFLVLILIGKENMALWAFFIAIGLLVSNFKVPEKRNASIVFGVFSLVYFVLMVKWIMPALGNAKHEYLHFQFSALGNDFGEAIKTIITKPGFTLELLVKNTTGDPYFNDFKRELYFMVLVSGGFALLFRPWYLIMLLPIFGQKLFNDAPEKWGISYQYCVEFIPILSIAAFELIWWITKNKKVMFGLGIFVCALSGYFSFGELVDRKTDWFPREQYQFWTKQHYQREFNVHKTYNKAFKLIPPNASVCAQTELSPHLAFRDSIFIYPQYENNVNYIIVCRSKTAYPLNDQQHREKIEKYLHSPDWQTIFDEDQILVFKRK